MSFWKKHPALRILLITVLFIAGIVAVISGWKMTGKLNGLYLMLAGVASLILALAVYNARFTTPRQK